MKQKIVPNNFNKLSVFDKETKQLNVIVETPKGSRNKYAFDDESGLFKMKGVLAAGHSFPFDFGFIPNTKGGDGDPLDVLVLMDEPAFAGCLIEARLIGVIKARQTERDGAVERNDRLIAVASDSRNHTHVNSLNDLNENLIDEIEHFFISYNEAKGKKFESLGRFGAQTARNIVEEGVKIARKKTAKAKPKAGK